VAALSLQSGESAGARVVFAGDAPRRAIIGVQVDPASGRDGARIVEVSPGGPAAAAGLRAGDVLQSIAGTDLRGRGDAARVLVERLREAEPGATLEVKVLRDGAVREFDLTPRRSPPMIAGGPFDVTMPRAGVLLGHGGLAGPGEGDMEWPIEGRSVAGLELATVTPSLGKYFGASQGVLVLRAPRQEGWKLQDGDVILAIDGREPSSGAHASRILRSYQAGERLTLRVMRERKALDLAIAVPEVDRLVGRRLRVIRMPGDAPRPDERPAARDLPLPQ
jgi:S1-C subfamily serine protease